MPKWWTYSLSDFLLFSPRTYFRLFELHNAAIWPAQIATLALGAALLFLQLRGGAGAGRASAAILAVLWLFVAWAYHLDRYATINWAAEYFAWGFAAEAALLAWFGVVRGHVLPGTEARPVAGAAGLGMLAFALALHPLLGPAVGRSWTGIELFGVAPDPTVVGTLGVLLRAGDYALGAAAAAARLVPRQRRHRARDEDARRRADAGARRARAAAGRMEQGRAAVNASHAPCSRPFAAPTIAARVGAGDASARGGAVRGRAARAVARGMNPGGRSPMSHGPKLPIKLDSTSNGEFVPVPVGSTIEYARKLAAERITGNARRVGQSRRRFMASVCGAATTLLALNDAFAARKARGGKFEIPPEGAFEVEGAQAITGQEFIFDIQTHFVEANGTAWRQGPVEGAKNFDVIGQLVAGLPPKACAAGRGTLQCYDADNYIKDVFLDSDTDIAVLSFVPALPGENPVSMKEAQRVQGLVAALGQGRRLLLHAMIVPNVDDKKRELARMAEVHKQYNISAWKVYPQWGPKGVGWWLDDPATGIPFIEEARKIGIKNICMHKGFAFPGNEPKYSSAEDVGRVAKKYPDMNFIVYHSGIEADRPEGAYDPAKADRGVDTLIKSLLDNGIPPNSNVYAEIGSTWRLVMQKPDQAAHTLGKLIKHVGAKRVLWGSDSIWYGSPQDQIQAFRAFQISQEFQDKFGYAPLTPQVKADIFGLNAAPLYGVDPIQRRRGSLDALDRMKAEYRHEPDPSFATLGPRDAAEWRRFRKHHGDRPG